ncbi:hypothetical protein [Fodinibius sp. SL11]|uniref:hypothetical protein n=1 Tax=Fodinibius sp. SL11 TaxID=3425690 RepID=UPI003F882405
MLKEVTLEEIEEEPKTLTEKGLGIVGTYFIAVFILFWAMNRFIDMRELGFTLYLIIQNVYLVDVIFGALYLFKKIEKDDNKFPQNEPAQS